MAQRWKWVAVEKAIKELDAKNKGDWFTSEQVSVTSNPLVKPKSADIFLRAWANPDIGKLGQGGPSTEIRRVNKNGEVIGTPEKRTNKRGKNQYRWIGGSRDAWKPD